MIFEIDTYLWDYVCPCRRRRLITEHPLREEAIRIWDRHAVAIPGTKAVLYVSITGDVNRTGGFLSNVPAPFPLKPFTFDPSKFSRPPF